MSPLWSRRRSTTLLPISNASARCATPIGGRRAIILTPVLLRQWHGAARDLGDRIGHQSTAYDTNFGPGNVEVHDTAVALESGDPDRAASTGSQLHLAPDLPPTRAGHHWQDVARAWVLTGDHGQALNALTNARHIAPQQTRYHPQVRETARVIALAERSKTDSVAHFANWLGIKI